MVILFSLDINRGKEMRNINITEISPESLKLNLDYLYTGKHAILITGPVGIGKSSIIKSFTEEKGIGLSIVYLSQMTPADIKGIPVPVFNTRTMEWFPPDCFPLVPNKALMKSLYKTALTDISNELNLYLNPISTVPIPNLDILLKLKEKLRDGFMNADLFETINFLEVTLNEDLNPIILTKLKDSLCYLNNIKDISEGKRAIEKFGNKGGVVFLDEILSVTDPQVQIAANELLLDKRLGEYELLPNWVVWGAGNRKEHGMPSLSNTATLDRLTHFNLTPDLNQWLKYAKRKGISKLIITFLENNPGCLHTGLTLNNDKLVFPTPRSWEVVSDFISEYPSITAASSAIKGRLGKDVGSEFLRFAEQVENLPDIKFLMECEDDNQIEAALKDISNTVTVWYLYDKIKSYILMSRSSTIEGGIKKNREQFITLSTQGLNIMTIGLNLELKRNTSTLPWGEVRSTLLNFLLSEGIYRFSSQGLRGVNEKKQIDYTRLPKNDILTLIFNIPQVKDMVSTESELMKRMKKEMKNMRGE